MRIWLAKRISRPATISNGTIIDIYVRHAILSHRRVCVESNDKACSAGFWLGINGNQQPMLFKYQRETMYWLVPRPAAKDFGNSAPDFRTNDEKGGRLLVRLLTINHGNRLPLLCWPAWCWSPAVKYVNSKLLELPYCAANDRRLFDPVDQVQL
jgi:hypothetical protein